MNEIFRDLGAMVHEQGEQIDTIEANVEKACTDVEQGTGQLQKAAIYQVKISNQLFKKKNVKKFVIPIL